MHDRETGRRVIHGHGGEPSMRRADERSTKNSARESNPISDAPRDAAARARGERGLTVTTQARTVWPGIGRGLAHEDLPKHLFRVAALHARRALAATDDDLDQLDRATSIGTAVELLAKALLAQLSPTLIAGKDPKSLLLYSGVPAIRAHEAKTKTVTECLSILKESHSIDYNPNTHAKLFAVRNLALHMGLVDSTIFEEALNTMTALCEQMLDVTKNYDAALARKAFWGPELLTQVEERLKEQQEARRLELEQRKAAAHRVYERLAQQVGPDKHVLIALADRLPDKFDGSSEEIQPRECPVCGYDGWLSYEIYRGDVHRDGEYIYVDLSAEAVEFICSVCRLHLGSELLSLVNMDENVDKGIDEATQEEIEAEESYAIESYLENEEKD